MNVEQFAVQYKVKAKREGCGDTIVPGKNQGGDVFLSARVKVGKSPDRAEHRSHIFDGYADGQFGFCLMLPTKTRWTLAKRKLVAAGFTIRQDGDTEGIATFYPTDRKQARLALKMAGVKTRRVMKAPSPAQIAARVAFSQASRCRVPELEAIS